MSMRDAILARALTRGLPTDEQTSEALAAWLEDHPEAVTTVQDGAITRAKLHTGVGNIVDLFEGASRITSLDELPLAKYIVDAVGIPTYVSNPANYSSWGLTKTGWYIFARIAAPGSVTAGSGTTVTGAEKSIITTDAAYVDVAVLFETAAQAKTVTVTWATGNEESFTFRATDLAIRNLDYRSTFYIYDISDFAEWTYAQAEDATFAEGKKYYTKSGSTYSAATVTAGDAIPAYYERSEVFTLTADETFQDGKTYYTLDDDQYTAAEVTTGDAVTADTYYEMSYSYALTEDTTFSGSKDYYTKSGDVYSEATVTANAAVPAYYKHSKLTFSGMTRNVTYKLDETVDCPIEIALPAVADDDYGCWFEIQMRYDGEYSTTLTPSETGVKVGTAATQAQKAGLNVIDLQYSEIGSAKVWTLLNTHTDFTADAPALASIAFRTNPTTTSYTVGDTLDLTGAEIVATYADGHTKLVTTDCTFTPASGATLTAEDTTLTASLTVGEVTETASISLTVEAAAAGEG